MCALYWLTPQDSMPRTIVARTTKGSPYKCASGAQLFKSLYHIRQALASLLPINITQLTSQHLQKSPKKKSDNNQCLYSSEDRMEDWQSC